MKIRKRMGLPRPRVVPPHRTRDAARQSVPEDAVEMLHDVIEEHQLAAKQRRLLDLGANRSQGESTPERLVALLNRMA